MLKEKFNKLKESEIDIVQLENFKLVNDNNMVFQAEIRATWEAFSKIGV